MFFLFFFLTDVLERILTIVESVASATENLRDSEERKKIFVGLPGGSAYSSGQRLATTTNTFGV